MKRRTFMALAAASVTVPNLGWAADQTYRPGLVDELLADGQTVFVDFYTSWCSTCRAQKRVIDALREENPDYDAKIAFVRVDWDIYSKDDLSARLDIPRRSTLVALKGNMMLGKIVAGTSRRDIKTLMDAALTAATS